MSEWRLVTVAVACLALMTGVGLIVVRPGSEGRFLPGLQDLRPANIDVATTALRQAKERAGIADCKPGSSINELPSVSLPCFGGGPDVRLDRLQGPLVVNIWQATCAPCRKELPHYQRLFRRIGDRVTVLGIDYNDAAAPLAMSLLAESGVSYPQLADPQEVLRTARPRIPMLGVPVLVLVNSTGHIAFAGPTAIQKYGQLTDLVERYLGVKA